MLKKKVHTSLDLQHTKGGHPDDFPSAFVMTLVLHVDSELETQVVHSIITATNISNEWRKSSVCKSNIEQKHI